MSAVETRKAIAQAKFYETVSKWLLFQYIIIAVSAGLALQSVLAGFVAFLALSVLSTSYKPVTVSINLALALFWAYLFYSMSSSSGVAVALASGAFAGFVSYAVNSDGVEGLRELNEDN